MSVIECAGLLCHAGTQFRWNIKIKKFENTEYLPMESNVDT